MECKCFSSIISMILAGVALIIATLAHFCPHKEKEGVAISDLDGKIKKLIASELKDNPQLVIDAMNEGMAKKREEVLKQLAKSVYDKKDAIMKGSMKFGKSGSKVHVICFFDTHCKHCGEFQKNMLKIVQAGKDVLFHLVPIAVLGEDSTALAKIYLAVFEKSHEKAMIFIEKIVNSTAAIDKEVIEKALKDSGLSRKEIDSLIETAEKKLEANVKIAEEVKIPVVPAVFVIMGTKVQMLQDLSIVNIEQAIQK